MDLTPIGAVRPAPQRETTTSPGEARLREVSQAFEAQFLADMLKHSGVNANPQGFGGGAGEEAFSSFLTQEYARLLAERGGVGLAAQIFESLKAREPGA